MRSKQKLLKISTFAVLAMAVAPLSSTAADLTLKRFDSPYHDFSILLPGPMQSVPLTNSKFENGKNNFQLKQDGHTFSVNSFKMAKSDASTSEATFAGFKKGVESEGWTYTDGRSDSGAGWSGRIFGFTGRDRSMTTLYAVAKDTDLVYLLTMDLPFKSDDTNRITNSFSINTPEAVKAHSAEPAPAEPKSFAFQLGRVTGFCLPVIAVILIARFLRRRKKNT